MSFDGSKTPLQLNVEAGLKANSGLWINPDAASYQGTWTAGQPYSTPVTGSYAQGTVTASTVLNLLTAALPAFYNLTPTTLCVQVWRNLLRIGRPVDNPTVNCPALGNSRPDTFQTTYAGFGSFQENSTLDAFNNVVAGSDLGLVDPVYPPRGYPTNGSSSYIYKNWSSLDPSPGWPTDCSQTVFSPYTDPAHYLHPYAWITGWPAVNSWQSKAPGNPQVAEDPVAASDTYAAAYYPRPDLAPVQPWRARDTGKIEYDEYFRHGFLATVARQAYYQFWSSYNSRRPAQYPEFLRSFQQYYSWMGASNETINSYTNTKTFLKGNYSNINDLTTGDFAGVNLAFKEFGNDLIRLGKTVDLEYIHQFGLPSKLLLTLQNANALTEALRLALLYNDLSTAEIGDILLPTYTPGVDQEKKIWNAFNLVRGGDLAEVLVTVNCTTVGLESLADLLDPMKMFPNSYRSLTTPKYSIDAPQSKIYYFIYTSTGVNTDIPDWGEYLEGILPGSLPQACGAFMASINQVKNIRQMDFEKVAQVVANLEVTDKGLTLIGSSAGVPGNVYLASSQLETIAYGSGSAGAWRTCDFLGAMSGQQYIEWYKKAQELVLKLQTPALESVYQQLYAYSQSGVFTSSQIQALIDAANAEILSIQVANPELVAQLNYWWGKIGAQLTVEQRAVALSVPRSENIYSDVGSSDIDAFTSAIEDYALQTAQGEAAPVLEAISDLTTVAGQSLVASMRESRNAQRILNTGGVLDNNVSNQPPCPVPVEADIAGGSVVAASTTGTTAGYTHCGSPSVIVVPQGGVFGVGNNWVTATNTASDCTFTAAIADWPGLTAVQPGWRSGIGVVSSATVSGADYIITVDGACFLQGSTYTFSSPALPAGAGATAVAVLDSLGGIQEITITSGGSGYTVAPTVLVECPAGPERLGDAEVPGSFAGSPYTGQDPVPNNLVSSPESSYTVDEAINVVTVCNCDCWGE